MELRLIIILFLFGITSVFVYADSNGIWTYPRDIEPGIFGEDESNDYLNENFTFNHLVYFNNDILVSSNVLSSSFIDIDNLSFFINPFGSSRFRIINSDVYYSYGSNQYFLDPKDNSRLNNVNILGLLELNGSNIYSLFVNEGQLNSISSSMIIDDTITTNDIDIENFSNLFITGDLNFSDNFSYYFNNTQVSNFKTYFIPQNTQTCTQAVDSANFEVGDISSGESGKGIASVFIQDDNGMWQMEVVRGDCSPMSNRPAFRITVPVNSNGNPIFGFFTNEGVLEQKSNWYQLNQNNLNSNLTCSDICGAVGKTNTIDPITGAMCTSGERAMKSIQDEGTTYTYGLWGGFRSDISTSKPESIEIFNIKRSVCYSNGQKKDGDATDLTVGCYCS